MNAFKKTSTLAVMMSVLIILLHGVVPHHHTEDGIAVCAGDGIVAQGHHFSHGQIFQQVDDCCVKHQHTQACATDCPHVEQGECHDDGLCGVVFAFVHASGSETADHALMMACLPVEYLSGFDNLTEDDSEPVLCDDHSCQNICGDVFATVIARRGPPAIC